MARLLTLVIGAAIGAALGGVLGVLVKSPDKAWAFIRTPGRGAVLGGVVGLAFAWYFGAPAGWRPDAESNVVPLTAETFDETLEETIAGDTPVVVCFYLRACPTCHRLAPKVEKLADEYEGRVVVAKVDAGAEGALSDRYEVNAVPKLVYFAGGEKVGATEGVVSYSRLTKQVEELIEQQAAARRDLPAPAAAPEADGASE
jgi:thioredoxin 1